MTGNTLEQRAAAKEMWIAALSAAGQTTRAAALTAGWQLDITDSIAISTIEAALRLSAGADWQPIETAPNGEPVVVFWRELQDPYDTARYGLDVLEDGVWNHHEECHQHFLSVAPPGSHGPSESAPYTHWMKLCAPLPAAPRHEPGEGSSCWCHQCSPITMSSMRMILCPDCGNKRCPHANDHRNACTGSNEPGQPGSAYP